MKSIATIGSFVGLLLLFIMIPLSMGADLLTAKQSQLFPFLKPKYDATGTWDYEQIIWGEDCINDVYDSLETGTIKIYQASQNFYFELKKEGFPVQIVNGSINYDIYYGFYPYAPSSGFLGKTFNFKLDSSSLATGYVNYLSPSAGFIDSPCSAVAIFKMKKQGVCIPTDTRMCLQNGRFTVSVTWEDEHGNTGDGHAIPSTDDSGLFWFFSSNNMELLIKVLDGCGVNNRYWVFFAATTDQKFTVRITDTEAEEQVEYTNPLKHAADAVTDTSAFNTCP
jgi:hypothetical protein